MKLKKLFYIKSDQEINSGMVRVMLELRGIKAEVQEAGLVMKDDQIVVVRKKK